jgi:hypothetical protein
MTNKSHRDKHRWIILGSAATLLSTAMVLAQEPTDDMAHAAKLLEAVRDNVFSFDDPAFYWFCRHVSSGKADASLADDGSDVALSWKMLMERPGDYRGKPVVIEGILQTRHAFDVSNREGLGRLYQCELSEVGTRALCAVICTRDPADVPIRSRVRAKGFFIKNRAYQTTTGENGAGPLIVARQLHVVTSADSGLPTGGPLTSVDRWMIPAVVALALAWLVLRRVARKTKAKPSFFPTPRRIRESEDDFAWLSETHSQQSNDTTGPDSNK